MIRLDKELRISVEDFAVEYDLPVSYVISLIKSNELPLDLLRMIAKKTGMNLKDVISYGDRD